MRRLIRLVVIGCMALTSGPYAFPSDAQGSVDAIIAIVNDEVITNKDLQDYIRQTHASMVAQGIAQDKIQAMMEELQADGLEQLIQDKLILSHANTIEIKVREKLVDDRIASIKAKYPSEQVFLTALVSNGATMTDLRNKILEQLKIKFVIDHEIRSQVFVNPQEVTDFYEQNSNQFRQGRRINLDSIYIAFLDDPANARRRADEALALIKEKQDFREVASQYSDTPSIGMVEEGQFVPSIEEEVFRMRLDQVSEPIETDKGIYIFKLKGEIPPATLELDEVRGKIYDILYHQKFQQRFERWLQKLKSKAYVEIKP